MDNSLLKVNLHTHTFRCNHAVGREREYVENAIKSGIKILGFADHTPQPFDNGHVSGMRMSMSQIEDYANTINDLKREYKDSIKILLGFEVEYYPRCFRGLCDALSDVEYDYFILAQHYTKNEYDGRYVGGRCSVETFGDYVDAVCEALDYDCFTYVAHPDLPRFTEDKDIYARYMRRICEKAKEKNVPLEINLLGLGERRFYPNAEFWKIAAEVGNDAVCGIDAHTPNDFNNHGKNYDEAVCMANNLGIKIINDEILLKSPKGSKGLPDISDIL